MADAAHVLVARLLDDGEPRAQPGIEPADGGGHDVGHDAGALAAAGDQKAERIAGRRVGHRRCRDHRRPQRIAGQGRFRSHCRCVAEHIGEGRGDGGDARRQKAVGAADDGVGIVNEARYAAPHRGQHRRNRRIAAEADHGRGLELRDQLARLVETGRERCKRLGDGDWIARLKRCARNDVDHVIGETAAEARGALVGHKMNRDAALAERCGERLGGKQVPARAASGDQHRRKIRRHARRVH